MANVYMGKDVEDFIFGEGTVFESVEEVVEEEVVEESYEELDACGVVECVDEPEVACYRIALENEMNYNAIMNSFMKKEYSVLESTGVEMVYEAADVKKFFKAVEEAIKRFWAKVQGLFKKIMDTIASYVNTNKAFVKKFRGYTGKLSTDIKDFKGYNFNDLTAINYEPIIKELNKEVNPSNISSYNDEEKAKAKKEAFKLDALKDAMRGSIVGGGAVKADEFKTKLKVKFYGSEKKEDVDVKDFGHLLDELEKAGSVKKAAKEAYDKARKCVNDMLGDIKKVKKESERSNPAMKVAKCYTDGCNAAINVMTTVMHAHVGAINTKMHQDRAMAAAMVRGTTWEKKEVVKKESVEEFDDIVLI